MVQARVPNISELVDARVTSLKPLRIGDYGFIVTANGILLGRGA